jgi:hypoxanthine phosphoribosyltransferase
MRRSADRHFRCEILSWARVARDTKRLSIMIKNSGYRPAIIVAIGRGGFVPGRILCDYLHIKDLTTIKVEHWGITAATDKKAAIKFPLCADIKDKRVLLVDDTTDTGDTLRVSTGYLKSFGPGEVRTAALIHKTSSAVIPDYYIRKVVKWKWIIFPWHLWEDLTFLVKETQARGIHSEDGIRHELAKRYSITISTDIIKEVVQDV